jgi:hypothetical protein
LQLGLKQEIRDETEIGIPMFLVPN